MRYVASRSLVNRARWQWQYPGSKQKTFVYRLYDVGPTSSTLVQRCTKIRQMFCVYWVVTIACDLSDLDICAMTNRPLLQSKCI